jgi:hypothetical protein
MPKIFLGIGPLACPENLPYILRDLRKSIRNVRKPAAPERKVQPSTFEERCSGAARLFNLSAIRVLISSKCYGRAPTSMEGELGVSARFPCDVRTAATLHECVCFL